MDFNLNGTIYRETIFSGYFVTMTGEVAQISFENGQLKKFFLMKPELTKTGHNRIEINGKHYLVHRLVYQTWMGGFDPLDTELVIDHIDANPTNNVIYNLHQVSQYENIQNAISHGNFGHNHNTKVKVYDDLTGVEKIYDSIKDFYIDINAPVYMIEHGGLSSLQKRKEYKRYHVTKINEH